MTTESVASHRKWLHIWVILLCVGIVAQGGFFIWALTEGSSRREADAAQIEKNEAAIRLLCDRGYLINDIIVSLQVLSQRNPQWIGEDEFYQSLELGYTQLLDQLTSEDSPCVKE